MSTALAQDIPVTRVCGQRDAALELMGQAIELIKRGHELADEARSVANSAAGGSVFGLVDRSTDAAFGRLFQKFDPEKSSQVFRHHTDACVWMHLYRITGMEHLMDATAKGEFFQGLASPDNVPEVNEDNVWSVLEGFRDDAQLVFQRGLARAFSDLDKRFKSHDAFKIGSRIILTHVFDGWGSWSYHSKARAAITDIERVFAVLDGQHPQPGELEKKVKESRPGWGPQQGVAETPYFRIRTFKNGNAHLWMLRDDLVEKANLVLAEYYGEVLPDGVPREEDELRTKSGLPAKDLSFYATPDPVVRKLLKDLWLPQNARVLEPSAGTGHIARTLLAKGWAVDAVEIDAGRAKALSAISGLNVLPANFLRLPARPEYDAVVMNPPFYGTHWMEHVMHAFDFLKPGGILHTVLPVTAELGQSAKHKKFRTWAKKHARRGRLRFEELPAESFAESGTRINTVILELHKDKARVVVGGGS